MNKNIWLYYMALPYTTAVYYERALRKTNHVVTLGPSPDDLLIERWNLAPIRNRFKPHDVVCDSNVNSSYVNQQLGVPGQPDLFLWIESGAGFLPQELVRLTCPKAAIFIDSHINIGYQLEWAKYFDYVFIAQAEYLETFRKHGINVYWLPLAADLEMHQKYVLPKSHALGMAGSIFGGTRREQLIQKIQSRFDIAIERLFLEDMARFYSQSKMVFNNAINNDLNMRVFETMSIGSALLTDLAKNSGQDILFKDHQDLILYSDENILDKIEYYLKHNAQRERIAAQGHQIVINAHQYIHRANDLLDVIFNQKANTFSAEELRHRSTALTTKPSLISLKNNNVDISYIIPVLDYSPASQFNIKTLLKDLEDMKGDVIIIFNNAAIAEQLKNHPRINRYAVMSQNIGVSRAWNVGLNLSTTKFNFILNADLHIGSEGAKKLLQFMSDNQKAALVGPQGSFFDFESLKDFYYFDKATFGAPIQVDAVSGFYFLVNKRLFDEHGIQFDTLFTPCYREEWDTGLQLRKAGLASYIVPISDYEHQWSGSINSYKKIQYLGQEEDLGSILQRSGIDFQAKWRRISNQSGLSLESMWKNFALKSIEDCIKANKLDQAKGIVNILLHQFPNCKLVLSSAGLVQYHSGLIKDALDCFKKSLAIDPGYLVARQNIELIESRHGKIG